jgi:hypothetical protein
LQWVAANGHGVHNGNGTVGAGGTVHLSLNFSEAVNVTGSPSLALNSNGTAKYVSGSGTNTLQFDYKVGAGQSAADLAITGFNLGGVKDQTGNTVKLSGAPTQPAGTLAIRTTAPTAVTNAAVNTGAPSVVPTKPSLGGGPNLVGVPSGFGNNNTTLGYAANTATASGNSTATDGALALKMALFNQYVASSFANPAPSAGAPPQQPAWVNAIQTLARPNG